MFKKVAWIVVVILFLGFVLSKIVLYQPKGIPLETWDYVDDNQMTSISLPYYRSLDQSGIHNFYYHTGALEAPYLVIPQLYGSAFKLYVNDTYVTGVGDFLNPTANLWTYAQAIELSSHSHLENNTIQLVVYGLHDVGFNAVPFLTDQASAIRRVTAINMLNHDLTQIFIGSALAFALIFFFLTSKMTHHKSVYISYGIGLCLFAFYSLEFTFRGTSGTLETYLLLRKMLLIAIYVAGYFLLIAQRSYFLNRKTHPLFSLLYGIPLILMVSAKDFTGIAQAQSFLNWIALTTILYIALIGFIKRYRATLIPNTLLVITVLHTIFNISFELMQPYILHLGVMIFLFGLSTVIVMDFQILEKENKKLGQLSKTDPLTQAFNRSILSTLNCSKDDYFVFIDLDRFKAYNDTHGHHQGDQILKDIVMIFKNHVRKSDYVIRYGGDEFILYFCSSTLEAVTSIVLTIQTCVQALGPIDISYGICSYEDSVMTTILNADRQMYAMKNKKKHPSTES